MRCFILIALCVALASANLNQYRFKKLLNLYQQQKLQKLQQQPYGLWKGLWNNNFDDDVYGDYDDNILLNKNNLYGDFDDDLSLNNNNYDDIYYGVGDDDLLGGGQGWLNAGRQQYPVLSQLYNNIDYDVNDVNDNVVDFDDVLGGRRDVLLGADEEQYGFATIKDIHDANVKLATKLYKQTKEDKDDKNTVVSPLSIQLALAALNQGARGNTKRQINRVTGAKGNTHAQKRVFKLLTKQLRRGFYGNNDVVDNVFGQSSFTSTRINPVTLIAVNQRTPTQQLFIQLVRQTQPGCQVKHCNFHNQPQSCRKMINNWVSQKTNMKINQIVPRDAITDNTKMVLVNALEMKAPWGRQMRNHITKQAKFFPLETNKVKIVEVMETVGQFKHYEDELVKIVGIPTKQHQLTMYLIVPKHKDGLTAVEKLHLQDNVQLKQILKQADRHVRQVAVQVPKFQIKHKIDARRTLQKQGVTDCFDPLRADFSRITGVSKTAITEIEDNLDDKTLDYNNDDLFLRNQYGAGVFGGDKKVHLNKFIHQCTIKVSENGITAATQLDDINNVNRFDNIIDDEQLLDNDYNQWNKINKFNQWNKIDQLGGLDFQDEYMDDDTTFDNVFGGRNNLMMGGEKMVKANRAFAFVIKHNPTEQLVMVGRVIDAGQKNINNAIQTINNVDQF